MSPNFLNPVLFTVLSDAITLAKMLSSAGLALDAFGVVILLVQDLRKRREEADATDLSRPITPEMIAAAQEYMLRGTPFPDMGPHLRAVILLRGTRTGFGLILAGFMSQLAGTLIS